jgi:archaellum component FlaG (FlaF/FlaG flagellin family)
MNKPMNLPSPPRKRAGKRAGLAAVLLLFVIGGGTLAARMFFTGSPSTGMVAVTTSPPGVQVFVDGQAHGVSPTSLTVAAGAHVLELRGAGEPRTIPIEVAAGAQLSQYVEMAKSPSTLGNLQVRTEPSGGRISVDGVPIGPSPVTVVDLQPGEHTVVVQTEAGTTRQTVVVEAGATASLVAQLPTAAAPSGPASGWISVKAPRTVQLFEDGRLLGSSDTERLMVPTGTHRLEIVNEALGFRDTRSVQVVAGKVAPIAVEFPKGTIALNAVPWADVWINGEKVGETPIGNLSLTIGSHEVIFRHPELGEQRHVATVTLNGPARLSVDLRKRP